MQCLECGQSVKPLDNKHLLRCSGLTLQEYALRYSLSLDVLVAHELINQQESIDGYAHCGAVTREARIIFTALQFAGKLKHDDLFCYIAGEVRQLDQLLYLKERLQPFGFQFRQEYIFNRTTHRVVALNHLKARRQNATAESESITQDWSVSEWLLFSAILLAASSAFYGGYVFFTVNDQTIAERLQEIFERYFGIRFRLLNGQGRQYILRTLMRNDSRTLLNILKPQIEDIPGVSERYYSPQPQATVAKQLTFDCAHFITDHPGKCSNLHGGRYDLIVKVHDRIDPQTGFVVDYGYLKSVVEREVIKQLDHQSLNLADPSLAWRSSTEHISLFIWERLIHYLPNLNELQIYETAQSYCCFAGPSLDELQESGDKIKPSHFQNRQLGQSRWRRQIRQGEQSLPLRIVRGGERRS